MQIRFEPEAEADLAEARRWYGRQRAGLDIALMLRVDEILARIVNAPYLYPIVYRQLRRAFYVSFLSPFFTTWCTTRFEYSPVYLTVVIENNSDHESAPDPAREPIGS